MDTPTRLLLLRHAEVEEKYHRTFGGRIDMALSARGIEQAETLARYLRRSRLDAIYTSPMKRAQQTTSALARDRTVSPVACEDLREVDFGAWTGLRWEEVTGRFNVSPYCWLAKLEEAAIPGAESALRLRERVEPCLRQLLAENPARSVAIVCHGGVIRMMLSVLLGLPWTSMGAMEIEYASLTQISWLPWKSELQLLNFTPWRDLP